MQNTLEVFRGILIEGSIPVPHCGCWLWEGAIISDASPYGCFSYNGKRYLTHRASYAAFIGEIPQSKPWICHTCDVPSCVNPDHLFAGTPKDNVDDMVRKGRAVFAPEAKARPKPPDPFTVEQRKLIKNWDGPTSELSNLIGVEEKLVENLRLAFESIKKNALPPRNGRIQIREYTTNRRVDGRQNWGL